MNRIEILELARAWRDRNTGNRVQGAAFPRAHAILLREARVDATVNPLEANDQFKLGFVGRDFVIRLEIDPADLKLVGVGYEYQMDKPGPVRKGVVFRIHGQNLLAADGTPVSVQSDDSHDDFFAQAMTVLMTGNNA